MKFFAALGAALTIATCVAAAPLDKAQIVDSGSTNAYGYTLDVSSDGKGVATLQRHGVATGSTPKAFSIPATTTTKFFKDVAAAKSGNAAGVPCMKSASFGSSLHVTWQGWTSPDLTCPPKDSLGEALIADVDAIKHAAGVSDLPSPHAAR